MNPEPLEQPLSAMEITGLFLNMAGSIDDPRLDFRREACGGEEAAVGRS